MSQLPSMEYASLLAIPLRQMERELHGSARTGARRRWRCVGGKLDSESRHSFHCRVTQCGKTLGEARRMEICVSCHQMRESVEG